MSTYSAIKDPDAVLDYKIDWASWLGTDTIATSEWIIEGTDAVLEVDNETEDATSATVWLSGGTANGTYIVTNRITTAGGRTDDRSIKIEVQER